MGWFLAARVAGGADPVGKALAVRHCSTADTATLQVAGLAKPLTLLHITDSHVTVADAGEASDPSYGSRMDKAYGSERVHWRTGKKALPMAHFLDLLAMAKDRHVDLVALTGDIVNNPSASSVRFIRKALDDTGIRWLYIAGNHDWHYEGLPGSDDALRAHWTRERLLPLYAGRDPMASSVQIGGINFVMIDNSTYQVSAGQLAFYEKEIARGLPTVLLMHIPVYTPAHAGANPSDCCGHPAWGWEADRGFAIERRERWSRDGNLKSTRDFVDRVGRPGNLVAVLAGHTHKACADQLSESAVQYIGQAGCTGGSRLVTFTPLARDGN